MEPPSFDRKLFPLVLIALGGTIIVAIILALFRAGQPWVAAIVIAFLFIIAGVIGVVASRAKAQDLTPPEPPMPSYSPKPAPFKVSARDTTAKVTAANPTPVDASVVSKPMQTGLIVLLASIALLLLCNLLVLLRPVFTVRETQIIDCRDVSDAAVDGWHVVSSYSYELGDASEGYTVYTECVMERESFGWPGGNGRDSEDKEAALDDFDFAPEPVAYPRATETPVLAIEPTQPPLPSPTP